MTFGSWSNLKDFFKRQHGFKSWTFDGDYQTLIIEFKNAKQASNAVKKNRQTDNEITAYGDVEINGKGEIIVELYDDAEKNLSNG